MNRGDRLDTIEAWLAEGPVTAPDRIVGELPARLSRTPQAAGLRLHRLTLFAAPVAAAAVIVAALVLSGVFDRPVGDDPAPVIPSPPASFEEGARMDVLLLVENLSERSYGSWHWTGSSGSAPTTPPCHAAITEFTLRAPAVIRFGPADPETEESLDRESLPILLSTDSLPGVPIGYRERPNPVWTYAYRVSVSAGDEVTVEPLDALSSTSAGPLCPVPDTRWPDGWPDVQAVLADRPTLPDCGVERVVRQYPAQASTGWNTEARQCFYDAWLAGDDAQIASVVHSPDGPWLEVFRTSGGQVERVLQTLQVRDAPPQVITCAGLIRPSQRSPEASLEDADRADVDATMVFLLDIETCS